MEPRCLPLPAPFVVQDEQTVTFTHCVVADPLPARARVRPSTRVRIDGVVCGREPR